MAPRDWNAMKQKYEKTFSDKLGFKSEVNDIIDKLVRCRLKMGLTQSEVARRAGIKQSALARIENFVVTPRLDTLLMLSNVLGLEIRVMEHNKVMPNQDFYYYQLTLERYYSAIPKRIPAREYDFNSRLPSVKQVFDYLDKPDRDLIANNIKRGVGYNVPH
ncbi:MAG: helix-turn-helix domain-containing protein [Bacillota bacterium]